MVAAHNRRNRPSLPRRSACSAKWMVALLPSKHAVMPRTSGSDSALAGVGLPITSLPR